MKKTMRKFTALFATAILLVLLVAPTGVFADTEPQGVSTQGATGTILDGTLNVSLASPTTAVVGEETDFTTEFVAGSAAALVEATATISIVGPAGAVTAADWNLEILDAGSWRTFDSWSAGSFTLVTGYGPVNWRFVPKGAPGAYTITLTITSLPNDGTLPYLPGGSSYAGNEVITYTETINVVNEFTLSGTALDTDFAILNTSAPMEGATLYGGMWNEFDINFALAGNGGTSAGGAAYGMPYWQGEPTLTINGSTTLPTGFLVEVNDPNLATGYQDYDTWVTAVKAANSGNFIVGATAAPIKIRIKAPYPSSLYAIDTHDFSLTVECTDTIDDLNDAGVDTTGTGYNLIDYGTTFQVKDPTTWVGEPDPMIADYKKNSGEGDLVFSILNNYTGVTSYVGFFGVLAVEDSAGNYVWLTSADYSSAAGAGNETIITLNSAYLDTLTPGEYTLRVYFEDSVHQGGVGVAEGIGYFVITSGAIDTGDASMPGLWTALSVLALAGMALVGGRLYKREKAQTL